MFNSNKSRVWNVLAKLEGEEEMIARERRDDGSDEEEVRYNRQGEVRREVVRR